MTVFFPRMNAHLHINSKKNSSLISLAAIQHTNMYAKKAVQIKLKARLQRVAQSQNHFPVFFFINTKKYSHMYTE